MPEVVNVVGAGSLGRELEIRAVGADINAAEVKQQTGGYNTPTAYLREGKETPLVTAYVSGRYHVSGAKSVEEAKQAKNWFISELKRMGVEGINSTFSIKNVVALGDLGQSLDLNQLSLRLGLECVEYEPEQFPGLVFRPDELDIVFLIFSSGSVVIPGTSTKKEAFNGFDWLLDRMNSDSAFMSEA